MHLVKHLYLELALYNTVSFEYRISCSVGMEHYMSVAIYFFFFLACGVLVGFFWVSGRNVSFGNLNLSSSRGIGHVYFTLVMATKRMLNK